MKLLIIGGTRFVGRALADNALARGYEVTLFNRGNTNPEIYPEVEKLRGDRTSDLSALQGKSWDAVIDTCGYVPRIVGLSTDALKDSVGHYTFISTISVYAEPVHGAPGSDENAPLATLTDETVEEITGETYGGLKVLCENKVEEIFGQHSLNIRPGLIVGPHDPTDRFTYWVIRTARDAEVLAPPAEAPMQVIDVRDLAEFTLSMTEQKKTGAYNATGPDYRMTYGEVLAACQQAAESNDAEVYHASEEFLLANNVQPWADLPLWLPAGQDGLSQVSVQKGINDGLKFRPIAETVRDTLAWYNATYPTDSLLKTGLSPERAAEILAEWKRVRVK